VPAAIWFRYRVDPARAEAFEAAYAPDGAWAGFFASAPGYVRTELHRSADQPGEYLLGDVWRSLEDYERFLAEHREEYDRRGREAQRLYRSEERLGRFVAVR
jgi:heme-degrading monooxygenase HmoA